MGISKQSIEDLKNKSKISDFILSSTTGKLRGNKGWHCVLSTEKKQQV